MRRPINSTALGKKPPLPTSDLALATSGSTMAWIEVYFLLVNKFIQLYLEYITLSCQNTIFQNCSAVPG